MADSTQMRTIRAMAWERAKGELKSMLHTYWTDEDKYDVFHLELDNFIKKVEMDELQT